MRPIALLVAAVAMLSAADSKEFRKSVPLDAAGRFSLKTYKGSIHILGWDQPTAEIEARIVEDPGPFAMRVDDVEIRVDASSQEVRVKSDYRHQFRIVEGNLPFVYYTIHVPRGVSLSIDDYKSDSDISGLRGDVDFHTYKGTARLSDLERGLNLRTYKGDVRATFAKYTARTEIETYKGTVELTLPPTSAFDIREDFYRRANFDCDFPRTIHTARHDRNVRSQVNGGGPELRVSSHRGSVRLRSA